MCDDVVCCNVSKEKELDGFASGSNDESPDRGNKENESSIADSQGVLTKYATEISQMREGDQSVFDGSDNMAVLNLEETVGQGDEGLMGDQSGLERLEAQSTTARGSRGSMD